MDTTYAYLGEVTLEAFAQIVKAFPNIVGIDTTGEGEDMLIVLGCSKELDDKVIGMYQLITFMWEVDDDTKSAVWSHLV